MNSKILVIGGAGYLGAVLVNRLLELDYQVKVLDNFIYGRKALFHIDGHEDAEIIEGDIRNIESVNSAMNDVDAVILLAAVVGDPASLSRPEQTIATNYLASQAIASSCKLKGIERFIYASTCSVYGVGHEILDEDAPLNPVSLYAKTKISSEEIIQKMTDKNFAPTIMRMSTLYGYSPRMRFDLVVNTMTMTAYLDNIIKVFGGEQWRPLLHIKDAAESYIKVLETDIEIVRGKVYNVGSEKQNYQIKDVARMVSETIKKNFNKDVTVEIEKTSTDERDYRVSFKRIQNDLGFDVKYTIPDAVKEIYEMLVSKHIKDARHKVYYNHYFDSSEELIG